MNRDDALKLAGHLSIAQLERLVDGGGKPTQAMLLAARIVLALRRAQGHEPRPPRPRKKAKSPVTPTPIKSHPTPPPRFGSALRKLERGLRAQRLTPEQAAELRRAKEYREQQQALAEAQQRRNTEREQQDWRYGGRIAIPTRPKTAPQPPKAVPAARLRHQSAPVATDNARQSPAATAVPPLRARAAQATPAKRPLSERQRIAARIKLLAGEMRIRRYSSALSYSLLDDLDDSSPAYRQRASAAQQEGEAVQVMDELLHSLRRLDTHTDAELAALAALLETIQRASHPKEWLDQARHHLGKHRGTTGTR